MRAFLSAQNLDITRAYDFTEPDRMHGSCHVYPLRGIGPEADLLTRDCGSVWHQGRGGVEADRSFADGRQSTPWRARRRNGSWVTLDPGPNSMMESDR